MTKYIKTLIRWTLATRLVPITALAAMVFFVLSMGKMRYRGRLQVPRCHGFLFYPGPAPMRAITIGLGVFADGPLSTNLQHHENRHVVQWLMIGNLFPLIYFAACVYSRIKHGTWYVHNMFERDAREYAHSLSK
jgi:hypothetical protein